MKIDLSFECIADLQKFIKDFDRMFGSSGWQDVKQVESPFRQQTLPVKPVAPVVPVTPVAPVAPVTPAPVAPVTPAPVTPAPVQVAPVTPAPVAPAPAPVTPVVPVAPVAPAPAPVAPAPAPVTPVAPAPVQVTAPSYTKEELLRAAASLRTLGKVNELIALNSQFGLKCLTDIMPEQFGAYATALRGLGISI